MAAPLQYAVHPFSSYGYAYGPSTTTAVPPAADYTWGATAAQYSQWQTPSAQTSPNLLDPEPDALQSRTLFFGRLPDDITEEKLRSICEQHGDIKRISVYPEKRMAFVEFFDLRHADAARELLRGTELLGKKIEVQFSAVKRPDKDGNTGTLYVRPSSAVHAANWTDPNTLEAYKSLFSKHGDLKKISVNRKRETEKFVEYFDLRDAQKALDDLSGMNFNGATLNICFAQNASRTVNRNIERPSRRTPDSYGPYRGSGAGAERGASRGGYASAPYSATYAAATTPAYGAFAVPFQPAPTAFGLYAYQPQAQPQNGFGAQWIPATAPTVTAVPFTVAPTTGGRSSPVAAAGGTAPTSSAATYGGPVAPRW